MDPPLILQLKQFVGREISSVEVLTFLNQFLFSLKRTVFVMKALFCLPELVGGKKSRGNFW